MEKARAKRKPIIWGIGGHVIKCGLGPILIDLMRRGYLTAVTMNGAAMIHDFEVALAGATSEDVPVVLSRGKFGMAREMERARIAATGMRSPGTTSLMVPLLAAALKGQ